MANMARVGHAEHSLPPRNEPQPFTGSPAALPAKPRRGEHEKNLLQPRGRMLAARLLLPGGRVRGYCPLHPPVYGASPARQTPIRAVGRALSPVRRLSEAVHGGRKPGRIWRRTAPKGTGWLACRADVTPGGYENGLNDEAAVSERGHGTRHRRTWRWQVRGHRCLNAPRRPMENRSVSDSARRALAASEQAVRRAIRGLGRGRDGVEPVAEPRSQASDRRRAAKLVVPRRAARGELFSKAATM